MSGFNATKTRCSCGQNLSQYSYYLRENMTDPNLTDILEQMNIKKMCCRMNLLTRSTYPVIDTHKNAYADISNNNEHVFKRGFIVEKKDTLQYKSV